MNNAGVGRIQVRGRLPASVWLIALAMMLSACTPWTKAQAWPEETIRSAAQALVDGYNQGDLTAFDSFFAAPVQVADPAGLARTQEAAHQWLDQAQPGSTVQLLALTVAAPKPANPEVLASVHYRARLRLDDDQSAADTRQIEQTVQLERVGDKWLIISGDEAQITSATTPAGAPATAATIPNDSASATGASVEMLANTLKIAPLQIKVVSREALSWPDACLGVVQPGVTCQPGETPGFRIALEADGQRYEFHTDSNGLIVLPSKEEPSDRVPAKASSG